MQTVPQEIIYYHSVSKWFCKCSSLHRRFSRIPWDYISVWIFRLMCNLTENKLYKWVFQTDYLRATSSYNINILSMFKNLKRINYIFVVFENNLLIINKIDIIKLYFAFIYLIKWIYSDFFMDLKNQCIYRSNVYI